MDYRHEDMVIFHNAMVPIHIYNLTLYRHLDLKKLNVKNSLNKTQTKNYNMEKHYKKLSLPFLVKGIVTGIVFMLSSSARAQLSGNYTINAAAAASATNYTSWGALDRKSVV